jgi:hypothetical protein
MEAVRTSETSVDNHFTRQYNPEDSSEHHTRRRENLKSHKKISCNICWVISYLSSTARAEACKLTRVKSLDSNSIPYEKKELVLGFK